MAGYTASGRITRAHPRFLGSGGTWASEPTHVGASETPRPARPVDTRPLGQRFDEWRTSAREEWAQATFYLFDPNSWR